MVAQVVAHRTTDREVPGLILAGRWAFLSLFFSSVNQWCVLNQVLSGGAKKKNGGLAVQLEAKQA